MSHSLRPALSAALSALALLSLPLLAQAAQQNVSITDSQFIPGSISVAPGDSVTWINNGAAIHSVVADGGAFNSGQLSPGQSFSVTFNQPASYTYRDPNYSMGGTIAVSSSYVNPNANYQPTPAPAPSSSADVSSLYAQVQALLAQVNALEGQQGSSAAPAPAASGSCPQLTRTLSYGMSGGDVTQLQQYLASDPSVYPEGVASGYFGSLTQAAVQRWQAKYGIVSSGTPATTGYGVVGPHTRAAIAQQCSSGSSGNGGATAGGFIQVSPVTGNASLTVSISATINTANSCDAAIYLLDFGDGSSPQQIAMPSGACAQQVQSFSHTYTAPGTYNVTLSSGGHSTSATVTVTGTNVSVAQGTISAFTTNGNAPLAVTFYVSCAAGTAYDVVFGDGTDLGGSGVSGTGNTCGAGGLATIQHTYTQPGSYTAQLVIFTQQSSGTVAPTTVGNVPITVTGASTATGSVQGSISAFTTTGNAPLAVTFYVSCAAGVAYDVVFGDGTDLGGTGVSSSGTTCGTGGLSSASHTYNNPGSYTAQLVIFSRQSNGTVTPTTEGTVPITVGSVATNYAYNAPTLSADSVYDYSVQFDLPTSCTGYTIDWGDGSAPVFQNDGGGSCAQTASNVTEQHTYSQLGTYTITIKRGPTGSVHTDTLTANVAYSYSPPQITPGSTSLSFSLTFDLPTSCTGYDIAWGDGSSDTIQSDGGSSCAQTASATVTRGHTYAQTGTYTITLRRGPTLAQVDSVGVTVQ